MGEARRRAEKGLPPRSPEKKQIKSDNSPRVFGWLPITVAQKEQFYAITTRGAWIGIFAVLLFWIVVRFVGPAAGWWTPADA